MFEWACEKEKYRRIIYNRNIPKWKAVAWKHTLPYATMILEA